MITNNVYTFSLEFIMGWPAFDYDLVSLVTLIVIEPHKWLLFQVTWIEVEPNMMLLLWGPQLDKDIYTGHTNVTFLLGQKSVHCRGNLAGICCLTDYKESKSRKAKLIITFVTHSHGPDLPVIGSFSKLSIDYCKKTNRNISPNKNKETSWGWTGPSSR